MQNAEQALLRPSRPPRSAALAAALERCAKGHGVALRLAAVPAPAVAAALLEDAAQVGQGLVWPGRAGELWLLGTAPAAAEQARRRLEALGWAAEAPPAEALLQLPDEPPAMPAPRLPAAGLEARAAAATSPPLAALWRLGAAGPEVLGQRWAPDPAAIFDGPQAELGGHARDLLCTGLLARAAARAWPAGRRTGVTLLLDVPGLPEPPPLPGPPDVAAPHALVLPLALAPHLEAWARAATGAGWGIAWHGMVPELAHLMRPGVLPGALFFAVWSDAVPDHPWPAPERLAVAAPADRGAMARLLRAGLAVLSDIPS